MRHFPIEVIKMIEDSRKLVHLRARWWGTFWMCERLKGKAPQCILHTVYVRVCVCVCVCELKCHRCRTSCKMGLAWKRAERRWSDAHRRATSFRRTSEQTAKNIYHHTTATYILIWPSSNRRGEKRKKQKKSPALPTSALLFCLCV